MVTSVNTSDDLPGTTKGGVNYSPQMQTPTAPSPGTGGQFDMLNQTGVHLSVDGAFAVGDNTSGS